MSRPATPIWKPSDADRKYLEGLFACLEQAPVRLVQMQIPPYGAADRLASGVKGAVEALREILVPR
jgi:hypothetical protein